MKFQYTRFPLHLNIVYSNIPLVLKLMNYTILKHNVSGKNFLQVKLTQTTGPRLCSHPSSMSTFILYLQNTVSVKPHGIHNIEIDCRTQLLVYKCLCCEDIECEWSLQLNQEFWGLIQLSILCSWSQE